MKTQGRDKLGTIINLRVEEGQLAKLEAMTGALGLTKSEVIRRLIDVAVWSPVVLVANVRQAPHGGAENGER